MDESDNNGSDGIEVFDLDLKEIPIRLRKSGVVTDYVIRELDGPGRKRWQGLCEAATKTKGGVVLKVTDPVGLQHKLLTMTIFDVTTNKPIDEAFVRSWPSTTQLKLFFESRNLSGLDREAAESAKND